MPPFKNLGLEAPRQKGRSAPPPLFGSKPPEAATVVERKGPNRMAATTVKKAPGVASVSREEVAMDEEPIPAPPAPRGGGGQGIAPAAVSYRTENETCSSCVHMNRGRCDQLQMAVGEGDSCNLHEDRGGGMGEMPLTEAEGEEEEYPV